VTVTAFKRYQAFMPLWSHAGFSTILGYTDHFAEIELEYSVLSEEIRDIVAIPFGPLSPRKRGVLGGPIASDHKREETHPNRIRLMSSWSISARLSRNTSFAST
jgi:hypothetical protein